MTIYMLSQRVIHAISIHSVTIDGAYGSVSGTQESLKY